jgi:dephospho-CoA kinase
MAIVLFGLTGGVASGKSTVASRFRERGLPVIDADALARKLVEPGSEGLAAVVEAFGAGVLTPDGALDRKALAACVFGDAAQRERLNQLLHPRVRRLTRREADRLEREGEPLACYEAALLVENGLERELRPLVVVAAPVELQLVRLMRRDGLSESEARQRLGAQLPLERKIAVADHLVDSSGTLEQTRGRADVVLEQIRLEVAQGRWRKVR